MNTQILLTIDIIKKLAKNFQEATFRYIVMPDDTNLVEVSPITIYQNDDFQEKKLDMLMEFSTQFPYESLIFISEQDIITLIDKPHYIIGKGKEEQSKELELMLAIKEPNYNFLKDYKEQFINPDKLKLSEKKQSLQSYRNLAQPQATKYKLSSVSYS